MATRMPLSVPSTITPRAAASAQRNSINRTRRMAFSSGRLMSPIE